MPAAEIKQLRKSGRVQEAYVMAKAELQADPENIWGKRNLSWVLYEVLKANNSLAQYNQFVNTLIELSDLDLPEDEKMLYDQLGWQIGKMVFSLLKEDLISLGKIIDLFNLARTFHYTKPSEVSTFVFKAFHKSFKESPTYLELVDWWGLNSFNPADYEKEKLPNGKEVMSIVEQAYIAYAKHLLPKYMPNSEPVFDRERVSTFMPLLDNLIENHPEFQYPAYFKGKLLLAQGNTENMLQALLPFARRKRNDFWVWEILAEAHPTDQQKVLACHCKALTCPTSDDFLVNVRQKMAEYFVKHQLYDEAKTEILKILAVKNANEHRIPGIINTWMLADWYDNSKTKSTNDEFYRKHVAVADSILYSDIPEEPIIVEFVNSAKGILNFIASEQKFGFLKYDRFLREIGVGETLWVRFNGTQTTGKFQLYTLEKRPAEKLVLEFIRNVQGTLRIPDGKPFGFIDDIFVPPQIVSQHNLVAGQDVSGKAIKAFNEKSCRWGWKLFQLS